MLMRLIRWIYARCPIVLRRHHNEALDDTDAFWQQMLNDTVLVTANDNSEWSNAVHKVCRQRWDGIITEQDLTNMLVYLRYNHTYS